VGRTANINGNENSGCMLEYLALSCLVSLHAAELSMAKKSVTTDLRSGAGKGASSEQI
jgi:hypothetical protein